MSIKKPVPMNFWVKPARHFSRHQLCGTCLQGLPLLPCVALQCSFAAHTASLTLQRPGGFQNGSSSSSWTADGYALCPREECLGLCDLSISRGPTLFSSRGGNCLCKITGGWRAGNNVLTQGPRSQKSYISILGVPSLG